MHDEATMATVEYLIVFLPFSFYRISPLPPPSVYWSLSGQVAFINQRKIGMNYFYLESCCWPCISIYTWREGNELSNIQLWILIETLTLSLKPSCWGHQPLIRNLNWSSAISRNVFATLDVNPTLDLLLRLLLSLMLWELVIKTAASIAKVMCR